MNTADKLGAHLMFDSADRSPEALEAELEAQAERLETPCGDGVMVWHAWGEGPPVVLMHGAHGSWSHFIRNIPALARSRRVLAADIPGLGDSAKPPRPEDGDSYGEEVAKGLRQLFPGQPVDVVGFSMGGVLSAHMAGVAPDVIRRLILVDTGGLGNSVAPMSLRSTRGLEGEALRETYRHNLLVLMLHKPEAVDELALYLQAKNIPRCRVNPAPLVLPNKLLQALPRVKAQVDVIWGEHDHPHPNPEVQCSIVRQSHPDAELRVVPDAGHWSMYENAPAFNAALLELLEQPLRRR